MSAEFRRKTFVDSKVQGALARRIIYHWLVFIVVASVTTFLLQVLSNPFRPLADHVRSLWWTQGPFLVVLICLLPVFVIDTVKLSHRFAGPILSLNRAMREISMGGPPRKLSFRGGDFWHDVAENYNAMVERLTQATKAEAEVDNEAELIAATD